MSRRPLQTYLKRARSYIVYVGTPIHCPDRWERVAQLGSGELTLESGERVPLGSVRSFLVAYTNGELLDGDGLFLPLPDEVHQIGFADAPVEHVLDLAALEYGASYASVEYGVPRRGPDGNWYYATTLRNISGEPIRIVRFGGYMKRWWRWKLSTITGAFFSANEFRAWYGMGDRRWLAPGETAQDPDNYGSPPVIWAYFCESESGVRFVVGSILKRLQE